MSDPSLFDFDRDPTDLGLSRIEPDPLPHVCIGGWLAADTDGKPCPCLRCKPHLKLDPDGWKVKRTGDRKGKGRE